MSKKNLPISVDNFKDMIENNFYYFDKTEFIQELLAKDMRRTLFTRPRRFGKTLNMSMLKYFFDVREAEENKKLFENLKISKSKYFEKQGQHPVIFITFKDYEEDNWEDGFKMLKTNISMLYTEFSFLTEKLDEIEIEKFNDVRREKDNVNWKYTLLNLSRYLYNYYGKKVILLIDEYDKPLMKAYENGYYDKMINFFKSFYESAVKGNDYAKMTIMTGILQIAKEGIFSGLNNLKVNTILDESYTEYFGILEDEVEEALKYYEIDYKLKDVQKWYNGYLFGSTEVYNPWSIINFLDDRKLQAHWVNTSSTDEIINYLQHANEEIVYDLEKLFNKGTVIKEIYNNVTFRDIVNSILNKETKVNHNVELNNIWQFFLHCGYLTVEKKINENLYELKIPNEEILSFFKINGKHL